VRVESRREIKAMRHAHADRPPLIADGQIADVMADGCEDLLFLFDLALRLVRRLLAWPRST
jgi:hypothetical protein